MSGLPFRTLVLLAGSFATLAALVPVPVASAGDSPSSPASVAHTAPIASRLVLELTRTGKTPEARRERVDLGKSFGFQVALRNLTKQGIDIVLPGDGSAVGWREPHVYFTAERWSKKGWSKVARRPLSRCKQYDRNWHDEVVELSGGKRLSIKSWFDNPDRFQITAGRYRFFAHYEYRAPKKSGPMGDMPSFHIVSQPVLVTYHGASAAGTQQEAPQLPLRKRKAR
jgi:hypothetical protein